MGHRARETHRDPPQSLRLVVLLPRLGAVGEANRRIDAGATRPALRDGAIGLFGAVVEIGSFQDAAEREHVEGVLGQGARLRDHGQGLAGEGGEGHDVLKIVLEDLDHEAAVLAAEVLEIALGNEGAGDVVLAMKAHHAAFEGLQRARFEPRLPQPPPGVEHVEMARGLTEDPALQPEAAFEKRHVELLAVEGDDGVEAFEIAFHRADEGSLLVEVAHEVLANHEGLALDEADGDEEGRGAGAAREPGGLSVDERGLAGIEVLQIERGGEDAGRVGEGIDQLLEGGPAHPCVEPVGRVALEKLAVGRRDHLASNELREILGRSFEVIDVDCDCGARACPGVRAVEFVVGGTLDLRSRLLPAAHLLVDERLEPRLQRESAFPRGLLAPPSRLDMPPLLNLAKAVLQ